METAQAAPWRSTPKATALPQANQLLLTILMTFSIPVGEMKNCLQLPLIFSGTLFLPSVRFLKDPRSIFFILDSRSFTVGDFFGNSWAL